MLKILLIADNRDTRNIGCRGTSIALKEILNKNFIVDDILTRCETTTLYKISLSYFTEENVKLISYLNPKKYQEIKDRVKQVDAVVLNGEGTFIFKIVPRNDMLIYLIYLYICVQLNKPFFVVNAIFSKSPSIIGGGYTLQDEINPVTLDETMKLFRFAQLVTVRDMESYNLLKFYDTNNTVNLKYIPDALFSWYDFYDDKTNIEKLDYMLKYPHLSLSHDRNENMQSKFDFEHEYVLLSGSSFISLIKNNDGFVEERLTLLAKALKNMLDKYNINFYLLEACDGDYALRFAVPKNTGIPYIPVTTNIFLLGRLLGKSLCYISGRYHPSILASLGGAQCVFMDSNSHKTASLQGVLNYPESERKIYQAFPDEYEIENIVAAVEQIVKNKRDRNIVKETCKNNAIHAKKLSDIIVEYLNKKDPGLC